MSSLSGKRLGRFEVGDLLGAGGMAEVYRAHDPQLQRDVAIKVLRPDGRHACMNLLEREARSAARVGHPNVLAVHDIGTDSGILYLVTELLEGRTLRAALVDERPAAPRVLEWATQLAAGLAAAHARGIVHRDVKPENVFLTQSGALKVLDFGLARPLGLDAPAAHDTLTSSQTIVGTVNYVSPEQVRGEPADARSDVFAFGIVLFEMLTLQRPFERPTAIETLTAILRDAPPAVPEPSDGLAAALLRIARRCLEKDPEARFQSARDAGFALQLLGSGESRATAPAPAAEAPPARTRAIAVLVFRDLAQDPENAHLGLALADATITELALVRSLLVRPTSAILPFRDRDLPPDEVGRALGVEAVVHGTFQRHEGRLRVTVQLVSTADGQSLWGRKIDTSLDDLFRVQDEVSRAIASALEIELTPADERRRARAERRETAASNLLLQGRVHMLRETLEDLRAAIQAFERAVEIDPESALAWVGLASACQRMDFVFEPGRGWDVRAADACDRALGLDPWLPEAHVVRAGLLWSPHHAFDHAGAMSELSAAIAGRPNASDPHNKMGLVLLHVGLLDEALAAFERATAISPEAQNVPVYVALAHFCQGRFGEARAGSERAALQTAGPWLEYQIASCHLRDGDLERAASIAARLEREQPDDVLTASLGGLVAARRGDAPGARRAIERVRENRRAFGHAHHAEHDVACTYLVLDEAEAAFDWLRRAARNGLPCPDLYAADPLLDGLHGRPEFDALLASLRADTARYRDLYAQLASSAEAQP